MCLLAKTSQNRARKYHTNNVKRNFNIILRNDTLEFSRVFLAKYFGSPARLVKQTNVRTRYNDRLRNTRKRINRREKYERTRGHPRRVSISGAEERR